jgi:hypothetical protein
MVADFGPSTSSFLVTTARVKKPLLEGEPNGYPVR